VSVRLPAPWGATPALLAEPAFDPAAIDEQLVIEIRPAAPRHLLECYGGSRTRVARADELGFRHPGVDAAVAEVRRINARIDALFAGTVLELVPESRVIRAGQRHAGAVVTDLYFFDGEDLRGHTYGERRAVLDELLAVVDHDTLRAAPLLRARRLVHPERAFDVTDVIRVIPRIDAIVAR
jgi:hypothetical protein